MVDEPEDKLQEIADAYRAWMEETDQQSMQRRGASDAERVWYAAAIEFQDKHEGETEVDLTEYLNGCLSLVFIRHPDRHLSNENWLAFFDHYLTTVEGVLRQEMKLDEKLLQPLEEIRALLFDLHSGRRNVHIPPGAGKGKDPGEKSKLMGRVSALVTLYKEDDDDITFESASLSVAKFLETKKIIFDAGGATTVEGVGKFICDYRRDMLRGRRRDLLALFAYFSYLQGHAFQKELGFNQKLAGAHDLAKLTKKHIITDFGGQDLRAAGAIK